MTPSQPLTSGHSADTEPRATSQSRADTEPSVDTDPNAHLLSVQGLRRTYGEPPHEVVALDNVDLIVDPGELVAIMGPSGSGKSTLLTIAGGLEAPTSGTIRFAGRQLEQLSAVELAEIRRREIGFVFQGLNLLDGLSAIENVAAPLELDGVNATKAQAEARDLLASVGLGDRGDAFPDDLSGGERQRVAIARGLVGGRRMILADEPTGALDSQTGQAVMERLRMACKHDGAVVVVTHDPTVAAWADRVVTLRDGRVESSYRPGSRSVSSRGVGPDHEMVRR